MFCMIRIGHRAGHVVPKPIGELHDVRLGDGRHRLAVMLNGVLERVVSNPSRPFDGHRLNADARGLQAGRNLLARSRFVDLTDQLLGNGFTRLEFNTGVQVFRVFANNHKVHIAGFEECADPFVGLAGTNTGV